MIHRIADVAAALVERHDGQDLESVLDDSREQLAVVVPDEDVLFRVYETHPDVDGDVLGLPLAVLEVL